MSDQPSTARPRDPRSFYVVVKPIGSLCNLDCTYCYYRYKQALDCAKGTVPFSRQGEVFLQQGEAGAAKIGTVPVNSRISDDLLERFIRQYIAGQEEDPVLFNWHGGEPALLGLDFFRRVVELERKYAGPHRIENDFRYSFACNGECPKNRFLKTPDGQPGLNCLCSGTAHVSGGVRAPA